MTGNDGSPTSGVNIRSKDGWTPLSKFWAFRVASSKLITRGSERVL